MPCGVESSIYCCTTAVEALPNHQVGIVVIPRRHHVIAIELFLRLGQWYQNEVIWLRRDQGVHGITHDDPCLLGDSLAAPGT